MRISTTIFGVLTLILGAVCIYVGCGGSINSRGILIGTLVVLASIFIVAAIIPTKKNNENQIEENA